MEHKVSSRPIKPAQTAFEVEMSRLRNITTRALQGAKQLEKQLEHKEDLFNGAVARLKKRSGGSR